MSKQVTCADTVLDDVAISGIEIDRVLNGASHLRNDYLYRADSSILAMLFHSKPV
jgi:hypothetical protein